MPNSTQDASIADARFEQDIRFTTASDGVRIAYATTGDGPPRGGTVDYMKPVRLSAGA